MHHRAIGFSVNVNDPPQPFLSNALSIYRAMMLENELDDHSYAVYISVRHTYIDEEMAKWLFLCFFFFRYSLNLAADEFEWGKNIEPTGEKLRMMNAILFFSCVEWSSGYGGK